MELFEIYFGCPIAENRKKVNAEKPLTINDLISDKYILLQRGKKKYFLVLVD